MAGQVLQKVKRERRPRGNAGKKSDLRGSWTGSMKEEESQAGGFGG